MDALGKAGTSPIPPLEAPLDTAKTVETKPSAAPADAFVGSAAVTKSEETPLEAPILTGSIRTKFPLNDLGSIDTHGRWATGFVLDGGSVRLMWVTARRVNDAANKQGFEIAFFLQGPAIGKMKERMQKAGATQTPFPFYAGELAPNAADGKSTLVRNGPSWNPNGQALMVNNEGKYTVHFADAQPEALKGAVRIRTYGDDAASNAALAEVIDKLGLQHVFAPSTKGALERYKLVRLLWATQPEALDNLRFATAHEIDQAELDQRIESLKLAPDHPAFKAIDGIDLSDAKIERRVRLAKLLWDARPKAFYDWVKAEPSAVNGIFPGAGVGNEANLNAALTNAGIKADSPEYQAALQGKKPSAAFAKKLFELGFLVRTAAASATSLIERSLDEASIAKLKGIAAGAGVDLSKERLEKLELREVYPGYFTAYDPSMPDRLKDKGARYLYSTLDNPERVFEVLTAGQKASLTRFQEGRLVQGKSSSADFGTGGAFAVFSRLVTASAIDAAKKGTTTGGYYNSGAFNNWGGSRPYKVILNRSILGRLDWYGYNGDNYGRSTNLKAANHAEAIVETINKAYSSSNELMFGVGNDPKFIDFVICENDGQKTALLKYLEEHGLTTFRGKPIAELIRVETKFFEHPDDLTVEAAVRDAAMALPLKGAEDAVKALVGGWAAGQAEAMTKESANALAAEALPQVVKTLAQSAGQYQASQQITQLLNPAIAALPMPDIEAAAFEAAKAQGHSAPADPPANLATNVQWTISNQLQAAAMKAALAVVDADGPAIALAAAQQAKDAQPAGTNPQQLKQLMINAAAAAITAGTKDKISESIHGSMAGDANAAAEKALLSSCLSTARYAIQAGMLEAGAAAGRTKAEQLGTLAALEAQIAAEIPPKLQASVEATLKTQLPNALRQRVQQGTKPKTEAAMVAAISEEANAVAKTTAHDELLAVIQSTVQQWAEKHPEQAIDPKNPAFLAAAEQRALDVAKWFVGAEVGQSIDKVLAGAIDGATQAALAQDQAPLILGTITEIVQNLSQSMVLQQLRGKLNATLNKAVEEEATARAAEWTKATIVPAADQALTATVNNVVANYQLTQRARAIAEAQVKTIA
ncbi:MAG: hypothetical protein U1E65_09730 [Myxococcota bacterium]